MNCDYAVAVFTNLTRDHLDYHKTMENYWYAKQRLFDGRLGSRPKTSVINVDDPYGVELADRLEKEGLRVVRYAVKSDADVTARDRGVLFERNAISTCARRQASVIFILRWLGHRTSTTRWLRWRAGWRSDTRSR